MSAACGQSADGVSNIDRVPPQPCASGRRPNRDLLPSTSDPLNESGGPPEIADQHPRAGSDPTSADGWSDRELQAAHLVGLVGRAADGEEDAFAQLYDHTCDRIYRVILHVIRSRDLAAEVTQDVYVEIWRQAARYSPVKGQVLAWMTTVAHRRAVDRVRHEASHTARNQTYAQRNTDRHTDPVWDHVEQQLEQQLNVERVHQGLARLSDIQREALTLAYIGGHTHTQVAKLLNVPLGTAKTRIRDGLIGLRDALAVQT